VSDNAKRGSKKRRPRSAEERYPNWNWRPPQPGRTLIIFQGRSKQTTSVSVDAPQEGRPQTRINWMLRQLREGPDDLRIDVSFANVRETTAVLLKDAREYPKQLLCASDPKRDPRGFTLALSRKMGTKRGKGERSFVAETRKQAVDFYRSLVQNLRAWQPTPPKLPDEPKKAPDTPVPEPPPFTADEREVGEAMPPERAGSQ
jgi:hypothetical protein